MIDRFYSHYILRYPKSVLLLLFVLVAFLGSQAFKMEVDASAETLLLENDKDLHYSRMVSERYHTPDILVIAYTPTAALLSKEVRDDLKALSDELTQLSDVSSVTSILNVPLMQSPPRPIKEMLENIPILTSADVNYTMAKYEFLNSPIYKENLVSNNFKTTALMINLKTDARYRELLHLRDTLREKERTKSITPEERLQLKDTLKRFKRHRDAMRILNHQTIEDIRAIMQEHKAHAELFLGGVSMISDDMVGFVKEETRKHAIYPSGKDIFAAK